MLFTIILDYRGGTYIRQARAGSPKKALLQSIQDFDVISSTTKTQIASETANENIVEVAATRGVWCTSVTLRGKLGLFHIVATAS
jgi:hypothetical protein